MKWICLKKMATTTTDTTLWQMFKIHNMYVEHSGIDWTLQEPEEASHGSPKIYKNVRESVDTGPHSTHICYSIKCILYRPMKLVIR